MKIKSIHLKHNIRFPLIYKLINSNSFLLKKKEIKLITHKHVHQEHSI